MQYTKIVHLIGGEKILLTDMQAKELQEAIGRNAQGFIRLGSNLINKTSIAYVGDHHATAVIQRMDKYQEETNLKLKEYDIKRLN